MSQFEPRDPDWDRKVRESFARQTVMETIGASIAALEPGRCEILLPYRRDLCQQHGYLHAGITTAVADFGRRLCRVLPHASRRFGLDR